MIKIKNGFTFKVVGENITGEVDGLTRENIWSVVFRENGRMFARYDVYESTIKNNLELGIYEEV